MTTGLARITKTDLNGNVTDVAMLTSFQGDDIFAQTRDLDFGRPDINKDLIALVLDITGRGSISDVSVYIGYRQRLEDTLTWSSAYSMADQDKMLWLSPRVPQSRYFTLKVQDTLPQTTWKLSNIEFYGRFVGGRK